MSWLRPHLKPARGPQLASFYGQDLRALGLSRHRWGLNTLMVGFTIIAALLSYMVSMKVSNVRTEVEQLERENMQLAHEMKTLGDELRVRMRLPQLQEWNDRVFGLLPTSADQYLGTPAALARYKDEAPQVIEPPALRYAIVEPERIAGRPHLASARTPEAPETTAERPYRSGPARPEVRLADARQTDTHRTDAHRADAHRNDAPARPVVTLASAEVRTEARKDAFVASLQGTIAARDTGSRLADLAEEPSSAEAGGPTNLLRQVSLRSPAAPAGQ